MSRIKMSISFNRNNAQVAYESFIGADPNNLLDNKDIFKNHSLTYQEVQTLKNALRVDSINYFYNGLLTFAEGIDNVFNRRFSWATIKLYYSIYYMVRASMASKDIAILRCNNMYRLLVKSGARPFSTNNRKYNTTHEGTISHYKDVFKQSDILCFSGLYPVYSLVHLYTIVHLVLREVILLSSLAQMIFVLHT